MASHGAVIFILKQPKKQNKLKPSLLVSNMVLLAVVVTIILQLSDWLTSCVEGPRSRPWDSIRPRPSTLPGAIRKLNDDSF